MKVPAILGVLVVALAAAPGVELTTSNVQLRRAAVAALAEHEPARKADPESLVCLSLSKDAVLAGTALVSSEDESGTLGFAYLSEAAGDVPAGPYALVLQRSGIAVDLVDARGRVVLSVTLDPPFPGQQGQQGAPAWPAVFLTVSRWIAAKL